MAHAPVPRPEPSARNRHRRAMFTFPTQRGSKSMPRTVLTRLACGAALGLCTVWLAGVPPAQARDRISDREVEQARDACRQIAENRSWRDIREDVRDRDEDRGRVVVDVRGRRGGDEREHRCTYEVRDRYAAFDDQS